MEISIINYTFFNFSKINSAESFVIFPISSSVANKKKISEKHGVTGLGFKIHTTDGKKWVKFVAMQHTNVS